MCVALPTQLKGLPSFVTIQEGDILILEDRLAVQSHWPKMDGIISILYEICDSFQGGVQPVYFGSTCKVGNLCHELLHTHGALQCVGFCTSPERTHLIQLFVV
ncbi:unnamed protein product [Coregonus sp. 'balchen']|nr:unnamed protein product [Coregonus sp. 'balchen']